jgi:hypothetical protein
MVNILSKKLMLISIIKKLRNTTEKLSPKETSNKKEKANYPGSLLSPKF